ncbi:MAG: GAF domain-containing protein [Candidatus Rokubacteria bacterium]|nr:GAF domain-containing protein [Candidatus Rokubacteria bacterium]
MTDPAPRILLVDDDAALREATADLLRHAGFVVWEARDGAEGLRRAADHPDLVILDVQLPDIDGFEVCRRLREDREVAPVPILFLTGLHREHPDRVRALRAGADGYLVRPVRAVELIGAVRALLLRRAPGAAAAADPATALAEVGRELSRSTTDPAVLQRIADVIRRVFSVQLAVLWELGEDGGLRCVAVAGDPGAGWIGARLAAVGGLTERAVQLKRTVARRDVPGEAAIAALPTTSGVSHEDRAIAAAPLIAHGEVLGVLSLVDDTSRTLADGDLHLLAGFADTCALAAHNARLYTTSLRALERTDLLLSVGGELTTAPTGVEIARRAARLMARLLGADTGVYFAIDPRGRQAVGVAGYHMPAVFLRELGPQDLADVPNVLRDAIQGDAPLVVPSVRDDARLDHPLVRGMPIVPSSLVLIPVAGDRGTRGLLAATWWGAPKPIDPYDVHLAAGVAAQVGPALDHFHLGGDTDRQRREAEIIADLAATMNTSLHADAILDIVVRGATEMCRSDVARVALRDPETDELVIRRVVGARFGGYASLRIAPGHLPPGRALVSGRPQRGTAAAADVLNGAAGEHGEGLASELSVPIAAAGLVIGVLDVGSRGAAGFDERDESALVRLASHAAIALQNASLFEQAQTRWHRMVRLAEITRLLNASLEPQKVLDFATTAVRELLDADMASLWLLDDDGSRFTLRSHAAAGAATVAPLRSMPAGAGIPAWVTSHRAPHYSRVVAEDPLIFDREWVAHEGIVSQIMVPLVLGDLALGTVTVAMRRLRTFEDEEVALIEMFAAKAATALHNARLFEGAQNAYEELRRAQAQLVQAQKMEAIGRLSSGLAHDFNNVLTVIGGRAELIRRRPTLGHRERHDAELVAKAITRASALTRQLLALSRREVADPVPVDVHMVIADMWTLLTRLVGERVEMAFHADAPRAVVRADPTQLEQVVLNLCVNARDAMPEGGRLEIATATVHVDGEAGECLRLSVRDTGMGMDAATQRRVFEPFFSTKPAGTGTGLGLATVDDVVRRTRGTVSVDSAPGAGTTFVIHLPLTDELPAIRASGAPPATPGRGTETVLIAEDEPDVRRFVRDVVEDFGYQVLEAALPSTARALAAAHDGPIHALLTDVVLPGESGVALARHLQAARPGLRVLYMSGYADAASAVSAAGGVLLRKPFGALELGAALRGVLDARPPGGGVVP